MTGTEYRNLIATYIHKNFSSSQLVIYTEVSIGKTIIGKDRRIDVFVVHKNSQQALAIECKYQDSKGTVDEKIPYALQDLAALRMPGGLIYGGGGWSPGVLHTLAASPLAAYCFPSTSLVRDENTIEVDHMLASVFGFWELILPASKILK